MKGLKNKIKNMKGIIIISIFILFILVDNIYATNNDVTLEQINDNICTIKLENDGLFEKKIISVDNENKEVTMQMNIENFKIKNEVEPSEIFLVIDNSGSMLATTSTGKSRQQLINNAAKNLAKKILQASPNTKIGVIQFYKAYYQLDDAKLETQPTNVLSTIENSIDNIKATNGGTNTDAGLQLAKQKFTTSKNRIIILLTDGAPIACVGYVNNESGVINKTKQTLQSVINDSINLITVLTEVDSTYPFADGLTEKQIADQVYGTPSNPNYGSYYYVSDVTVEDTILNSVYSSVDAMISNDLNNINIVDIFPSNIIENYHIEITKEPNIGKVSLESDKLSWSIEQLKEGEKSSLQYKLKLKNNYNKNIINIETATNEKVDLSYINPTKESRNEFSDISPSIILRKSNTQENEIKEDNNNVIINNNILEENNNSNAIINDTIKEETLNKDNTTSQRFLPQTGENIRFIKYVLFFIITMLIICFLYYKQNYNDI